MSEYVDFRFMPLEGKITGKQVLKQTEDAINDLGQKVYSIDIDSDLIQQAIDDSQTALDTAEEALSVVTTDRAIWYNNVGELIQSNAEAGVTIATKGYYIPNDGGNGFYIVRNKQSADVDDGGSIIFMDSGRVAELIVTDEVNINQFGGVGDDTTDDNTAIVNAVAYASAKNKRLVFLEGYTYYTSLGIVITNPPDEIRMDGALRYRGSGTALTIGQASGGCNGKIVKIRVFGGSHVAGSNGVVLYNFDHSYIDLYDIRNFGDTAVTYCGNTKGFAYNTTRIGILYSTPILLKLTNIGGGWCNENKFFGGRFGVTSSDSFKDTVIGVLITSNDANYRQNGNIFYSPSMEIRNPVKIEYGQYNYFYSCRTEGATNPFDVTDKNNSYNYMSSSNGSYTFVQSIGGSVFDNADYPIEQKNSKSVIFDSGIIADNIASDGTYVSFAKLVIIGKSGALNLIYTRTSYASIVDGKLNLSGSNTSGSIGVVVDTTKNKSFLPIVIGSLTGRAVIAMWDADGNIITDEAPYYVSLAGHSIGNFNLVSGRSWYNIASSGTIGSKTMFVVPNKCARAFIGFGATGVLERLILTAENPSTYETFQNYETAVSDTIPTSAGVKGQFVKKTNPTADCIGWTYDGTNWLSVGEKGTWLENVASLRSANLPVGIVVSTKGYYSANDGGNGTYNIRAASSDVDDGGSIIILNNGNVAELITDGTANVKQFGAKGDGTTDDTTAIQNAIDLAKTVFVPNGTYNVNALKLKTGIEIVGNNKLDTILQSVGTVFESKEKNSYLNNVSIKNLSIKGLIGIDFHDRTMDAYIFDIEDVNFDCTNYGVYATKCFEWLFKNINLSADVGISGIYGPANTFTNIYEIKCRVMFHNCSGIFENINVSNSRTTETAFDFSGITRYGFFLTIINSNFEQCGKIIDTTSTTGLDSLIILGLNVLNTTLDTTTEYMLKLENTANVYIHIKSINPIPTKFLNMPTVSAIKSFFVNMDVPCRLGVVDNVKMPFQTFENDSYTTKTVLNNIKATMIEGANIPVQETKQVTSVIRLSSGTLLELTANGTNHTLYRVQSMQQPVSGKEYFKPGTIITVLNNIGAILDIVNDSSNYSFAENSTIADGTTKSYILQKDSTRTYWKEL